MISQDFLNSIINQPSTVPAKPISQAQAQAIVDDLQTALQLLQSARESARQLGLGALSNDAYSDICDAIHYCASASDYVAEIGGTEDA